MTSHSPTRSTVHPAASAASVLRLSRALLVSILSVQRSAFGPRNTLGPCFGQPCQKQPSTKTATWYLGSTKSAVHLGATLW